MCGGWCQSNLKKENYCALKLILLMKKISSHWIALSDQILVSGCNFVIGVFLARSLGVQMFGLYAIASTYLLYANTLQSSLIVSPMMTAIPLEQNETKQHDLLSGFLFKTLILIFFSVLFLAFAVHFLGKFVPSLYLGENFYPLLLAIIGFQLQDWLRRALYSIQRTLHVIVLDLMAYFGHIIILCLFFYLKILSPATVLLSMAGIFFFSAILMLFVNNIFPSYKHALWVVQANWRGSRDFFFASQCQWLGGQGLMLLGGGILGNEAIGAIRATQNFAAPMNVIFQWMENVVPIRAVGYLKKNGSLSMYKFLGKIGTVGGLTFGVTVIALYFFSEPLVVLLYGSAYLPYATFIVLQAIYMWQGHYYRLELFACRATENVTEVARASLIVAIVSILIAIGTIKILGGSGIFLALILGQTVSYFYLLIFRKLANKKEIDP